MYVVIEANTTPNGWFWILPWVPRRVAWYCSNILPSHTHSRIKILPETNNHESSKTIVYPGAVSIHVLCRRRHLLKWCRWYHPIYAGPPPEDYRRRRRELPKENAGTLSPAFDACPIYCWSITLYYHKKALSQFMPRQSAWNGMTCRRLETQRCRRQ